MLLIVVVVFRSGASTWVLKNNNFLSVHLIWLNLFNAELSRNGYWMAGTETPGGWRVGGWGGAGGWGGIIPTLHCHHQNESVL